MNLLGRAIDPLSIDILNPKKLKGDTSVSLKDGGPIVYLLL